MSNQEFENYIALIGKLLQLTREQRDQISGELQDHLQMRVADLMSEGASKQDAVAKALEEFGDAAVMAKNFQTVINLKRRRWMMRFATISMAGAFLAAILTMALWPDNARFGTPNSSLAQDTETKTAPPEQVDNNPVQLRLSDATQRDLKTEEALKQVVDLNYDETPFSEIMEELERRVRVNFLLHDSAKDDCLTEDEPLTFRISQLPLGKCLELMLVQKNAAYTIDEGVVVIVSLDDCEDNKHMRLKMFDCRELLDQLDASLHGGHAGAGHAGAGAAAGGGPGGLGALGGGGGSGITGVDGGGLGMGLPGSPGGPASKSKVVKSPHAPSGSTPREVMLLDLVFSMVEPDSWVHGSHGLASAQVVNGILIVRQTERGFRKIEHLLDDLEANVLPADMIKKARARKPAATKQATWDPVETSKDIRSFTDAIARDPGVLGIRGALDRRQGKTGNPVTKSKKDPFGETSKDPFGGSKKNPSGKIAKDPFSSAKSESSKDPFGN